jgi:hypothetical protein
MQASLKLTFAGSAPRLLVERATMAGFLPDGVPTWASIEGESRVATQPASVLVDTTNQLSISWGNDIRLSYSRKRDHLWLGRESWGVSADNLLALLRDLPFEACTTGVLDPSWWEGYDSIHGWAFAIKGTGHRLVSPRIVERGPWRLLRDDAHELTVFQFHDLDIDGATALAQARPGHALLALMWEAGHYAGRDWAFPGHVQIVGYKPSFYDPATRTSIVLVQDREVSPEEMGVAAATRIHQIYPEPVAQVAFVYMDEATARRQLPALWLYGLEVRAMTATGERRIDVDYEPPPVIAKM